MATPLSFFTQYGRYYPSQSIATDSIFAFKEHTQFQCFVDILSGKYTHHIILRAHLNSLLQVALMEAFSLFLSQRPMADYLRYADIIYLEVENLNFPKSKHATIRNHFQKMHEQLNLSPHCVIFVLSKMIDPEDAFLLNEFQNLGLHPKARFIIFTPASSLKKFPKLDFISIRLNELSKIDKLRFLQKHGHALEAFHHVHLPEEIIKQTYELAERYFTSELALDNTLHLLDISSARASATEKVGTDSTVKPLVTMTIVTNVLSHWIKIPPTHLQVQVQHFKTADFIRASSQMVVGQEAALQLISQAMQQAHSSFQKRSGPFCTFLLAGAATSQASKRSIACMLATYLFNQQDHLYFTDLASLSSQDFSQVKIRNKETQTLQLLKDVVEETPFAIFVFENIEHASIPIMAALQEIIMTGYITMPDDKARNFTKAILILTTHHGALALQSLANGASKVEDSHTFDFLQLLNETAAPPFPHSPHILVDTISPALNQQFPMISAYAHLIPLLPFNESNIEKFLKFKLNELGKELETEHAIEFTYAQEVLRYLIYKTKAVASPELLNPELALEKLYFCVEQALANRSVKNERSQQLFLKLNETGKLLRYSWLPLSTLKQHAL